MNVRFFISFSYRLLVTLHGADTIEKVDLIKEILQKDSRIINATLTTSMSRTNMDSVVGSLESKLGAPVPLNIRYMYADYDFAETFGVSLAEGRRLDSRVEGQNFFLVNEALVDQMGWSTGVGKKITYPNDPEYVDIVIGFLRNFNNV